MENFNSVELVKKICKDRGIPLGRLERECGFCNAYFRNIRSGSFPAEKALKISRYLDLPFEYIVTGEMPEKETFEMPDYDSRIHEIIMNFSDLNEVQKDSVFTMVKELSNAEKNSKKYEKYYNAYLAFTKGKNL